MTFTCLGSRNYHCPPIGLSNLYSNFTKYFGEPAKAYIISIVFANDYIFPLLVLNIASMRQSAIGMHGHFKTGSAGPILKANLIAAQLGRDAGSIPLAEEA